MCSLIFSGIASKNGSDTKFNVVLYCCTLLYTTKIPLFYSLSLEEMVRFGNIGVDHGWVVGSQNFGEASVQLGLARELEKILSRNITSFKAGLIGNGLKAYQELHCLYFISFYLVSKSRV